MEVQQKQLCPYCGGLKAIRNPTGKCDHLYYPELVNKSLKKGNRFYEKIKNFIERVSERLDSMGKIMIIEDMF